MCVKFSLFYFIIIIKKQITNLFYQKKKNINECCCFIRCSACKNTFSNLKLTYMNTFKLYYLSCYKLHLSSKMVRKIGHTKYCTDHDFFNDKIMNNANHKNMLLICIFIIFSSLTMIFFDSWICFHIFYPMNSIDRFSFKFTLAFKAST